MAYEARGHKRRIEGDEPNYTHEATPRNGSQAILAQKVSVWKMAVPMPLQVQLTLLICLARQAATAQLHLVDKAS